MRVAIDLTPTPYAYAHIQFRHEFFFVVNCLAWLPSKKISHHKTNVTDEDRYR